MSSRQTKQRGRRPKVVLVYGEDPLDAQAVAKLVAGIRPDLRDLVKPRRQVVILRKSPASKLRSQAQRMAALVEHERRVRTILAVVKHEDCDAVEPAHVQVAAKIEQALSDLGCPVVASAAAWELEAWFFLFPDACVAANPGWRRPDDYLGKNVGLIVDAKRELRRKLRPRDPDRKRRVPDYDEADAPRIAAKVVELDLLGEPQKTKTRSGSFEAFAQRARQIPLA